MKLLILALASSWLVLGHAEEQSPFLKKLIVVSKAKDCPAFNKLLDERLDQIIQGPEVSLTDAGDIGILQSFVDQPPKTAGCQVNADKVKSAVDKLEAEVKKRQDQKFALSDDDRFCDLLADKTHQEATIARQREVGRLTGVVNKTELYEAGNALAIANKYLAPRQSQFKAANHREATLSDCPERYQAGN